MPCFRGIELSVVTAPEGRPFPEFPHPDGSSAPYRSPQRGERKSAVFSSPRSWRAAAKNYEAGGRAVPVHADPRISVYIPSGPDTDFMLQYRVDQLPENVGYFFFKLLINGRHVVSWGLNLRKNALGTTQHALFAPSASCAESEVDKGGGLEYRSFRFISGAVASLAVARDGGLIEVRVFRAHARKRRSPRPERYRAGDSYGITLVSNGLLRAPHRYYDYLLADAKDAPYASFCFHYRSWANLRMLHLAPSEKPTFLWRRRRQSEQQQQQQPEQQTQKPPQPASQDVHSLARSQDAHSLARSLTETDLARCISAMLRVRPSPQRSPAKGEEDVGEEGEPARAGSALPLPAVFRGKPVQRDTQMYEKNGRLPEADDVFSSRDSTHATAQRRLALPSVDSLPLSPTPGQDSGSPCSLRQRRRSRQLLHGAGHSERTLAVPLP